MSKSDDSGCTNIGCIGLMVIFVVAMFFNNYNKEHGIGEGDSVRVPHLSAQDQAVATAKAFVHKSVPEGRQVIIQDVKYGHSAIRAGIRVHFIADRGAGEKLHNWHIVTTLDGRRIIWAIDVDTGDALYGDPMK